ncbi:hypothetical protein GEOBC_00385 [Geobacteraceae bacterium]|nr:hypothetical protein GEOBC_00385 [Geobacteraceae bacterium]
MRSVLVLSLALLPPLMVAVWTWVQLREAEKELGALNDFEGIHF